jgi:FixJ family two-component response regulator
VGCRYAFFNPIHFLECASLTEHSSDASVDIIISEWLQSNDGSSCRCVVDDDESLRTALKCLLGAAGYEVRTYASVVDFLLNKSGNPHGCVVFDVRMPGPSAFDLQDVLVKLDEPLPIIFVTGYGDIPTRIRSANTDAVDFLTKPIQKKALLRAVSAALAAQVKRRLAR